MKYQSLFSGKNKENITKLSSAEFSRTCLSLTQFSLETLKRIIGNHGRPRSETAECSIWSGSTLIALATGISIKHGKNKK